MLFLFRRTNELFSKVENIRELAIDATSVSGLAQALNNQAIKLSDMSSSFDFKTFALAMKRKFPRDGDEEGGHSSRSRGVDWARIGEEVGVFFTPVPKWRYVFP